MSTAPEPAQVEWLRSRLRRRTERCRGRVAYEIRIGGLDTPLCRDDTAAFPAASVIKLAVLACLLGEVDDGQLSLRAPLPLDRSRDVGGFGVLSELASVRELTVGEAAALMIAFSDNTAANACIDLLGFARISDRLRRLGCTRTGLRRHLMDLDADRRGLTNVTTAGEAVHLLGVLTEPGPLSAASVGWSGALLGRQRVRDRLPRLVGPGLQVANKTGEVPGVRHDVGLLRVAGSPGAGRTALVAVLTEGFTDPRTRDGVDGGAASELIARIGADVGRVLTGGH